MGGGTNEKLIAASVAGRAIPDTTTTKEVSASSDAAAALPAQIGAAAAAAAAGFKRRRMTVATAMMAAQDSYASKQYAAITSSPESGKRALYPHTTKHASYPHPPSGNLSAAALSSHSKMPPHPPPLSTFQRRHSIDGAIEKFERLGSPSNPSGNANGASPLFIPRPPLPAALSLPVKCNSISLPAVSGATALGTSSGLPAISRVSRALGPSSRTQPSSPTATSRPSSRNSSISMSESNTSLSLPTSEPSFNPDEKLLSPHRPLPVVVSSHLLDRSSPSHQRLPSLTGSLPSSPNTATAMRTIANIKTLQQQPQQHAQAASAGTRYRRVELNSPSGTSSSSGSVYSPSFSSMTSSPASTLSSLAVREDSLASRNCSASPVLLSRRRANFQSESPTASKQRERLTVNVSEHAAVAGPNSQQQQAAQQLAARVAGFYLNRSPIGGQKPSIRASMNLPRRDSSTASGQPSPTAISPLSPGTMGVSASSVSSSSSLLSGSRSVLECPPAFQQSGSASLPSSARASPLTCMRAMTGEKNIPSAIRIEQKTEAMASPVSTPPASSPVADSGNSSPSRPSFQSRRSLPAPIALAVCNSFDGDVIYNTPITPEQEEEEEKKEGTAAAAAAAADEQGKEVPMETHEHQPQEQQVAPDEPTELARARAAFVAEARRSIISLGSFSPMSASPLSSPQATQEEEENEAGRPNQLLASLPQTNQGSQVTIQLPPAMELKSTSGVPSELPGSRPVVPPFSVSDLGSLAFTLPEAPRASFSNLHRQTRDCMEDPHATSPQSSMAIDSAGQSNSLTVNTAAKGGKTPMSNRPASARGLAIQLAVSSKSPVGMASDHGFSELQDCEERLEEDEEEEDDAVDFWEKMDAGFGAFS
jgi:hypothetical protein